MPTLTHYLALSAVLFAIGIAGVFLRRNLITVLLSIEVMLNAGREAVQAGTKVAAGARAAGGVLAAVLGVELVWAVAEARRVTGAVPLDVDPAVVERLTSVRAIGQKLFTEYAFAFEVTSILILVSMVGAVVLAKRRGEP